MASGKLFSTPTAQVCGVYVLVAVPRGNCVRVYITSVLCCVMLCCAVLWPWCGFWYLYSAVRCTSAPDANGSAEGSLVEPQGRYPGGEPYQRRGDRFGPEDHRNVRLVSRVFVLLTSAALIVSSLGVVCSGSAIDDDVPDAVYPNYIRATVRTTLESRVVYGTRIGREVRITQMDHWSTFPSFKPAGHILFLNNVVRVAHLLCGCLGAAAFLCIAPRCLACATPGQAWYRARRGVGACGQQHQVSGDHDPIAARTVWWGC